MRADDQVLRALAQRHHNIPPVGPGFTADRFLDRKWLDREGQPSTAQQRGQGLEASFMGGGRRQASSVLDESGCLRRRRLRRRRGRGVQKREERERQQGGHDVQMI